MACRNAYRNQTITIEKMMDRKAENSSITNVNKTVTRLLFGVDSKAQSNTVLQNNLTEFEWATKNKIYPNFWGRLITGDVKLDKNEIEFLHDQGCKIAPIYETKALMETEEQGINEATEVVTQVLKLDIPMETAIFLVVSESATITRNYMRGFAKTLMENGYTPGFKANTDAKYVFDREYSRGLQTDKEIFERCLIWAVTPSLVEYERMTTTHLIHPDNWEPFAPSGITRNDIAIWQYGKECHPIHDNLDNETTFNVNLVRNEEVIIKKMF